MKHDEGRPLTRYDFDSAEDWLRYCHQSGIDLVDVTEGGQFNGVHGSGPYASLLAGIYGHNRQEYKRAWEGRVTDAIGLTQFKRAYRAVAFANCLGLILNTKVDVTWSTVGVRNDAQIAQLQNQLLDVLRGWYRRKGVPAAWLWVLENGQTHGVHTHLFFHVPDDQVIDFKSTNGFNEFLRRRLQYIVKRPLLLTPDSKTVRISHVNGRQVGWQWERFRYMMKGLRVVDRRSPHSDPTRRFAARGKLRLADQGRVMGRRVGFSPLLQDRSIALWQQRNALPDLNVGHSGPIAYDGRFLAWYDDHAHLLR
ncbi:hypothetical protein [Sphingomonas crocodyli]|uniref:Uncharacterized protein n=1 Tax=Sphingomonas crocodyli TaxID=1979270 RepID=A0A437M5P4_9SPHN|nr:hypothetical protein [Sphingomonas crocodyli]RVT92992.1 hypothetical protein EOD43_03560 [Sphingomonas crocodyli]